MEIAIISGKGGTGKSSITAAFASLNEDVVLVDCDVDAANLHIIFDPKHDEEFVYNGGDKAILDQDICTNCGLCVTYCRFDAIAFKNGRVEIAELACDGCQLCYRICPVHAIHMEPNDKSRMFSGSFRHGRMVYGRLAPGEENSGKLVNMVREKAREQAAIYALKNIIIDGPPGVGCALISTITGTDNVLIVTEPSLSGLHDMKRTVEICNQFSLKIWVLINKSDLNTRMAEQIENYCTENSIEVVAKIPFDRVVVDAMVNCKSISEYAPNSPITIALREAYNKIISS